VQGLSLWSMICSFLSSFEICCLKTFSISCSRTIASGTHQRLANVHIAFLCVLTLMYIILTFYTIVSTAYHHTTYELFPLPLVKRRYGLTSLTSPNFSFAFSVLTGTGTIKSSPTCQSIGLASPNLSVVCKLSITRSTSALLRPVLAGYVMLSLIFLLGSMMKTERIVRTMSLEPVADSGSMSY